MANIKIFFFQFTVSTVKLYIRKLGCRGAVNYRPRHVQKLLRLGYQRESGGGVECSRVYPPDELSQVFIGSTRQVTPAVSTERSPLPRASNIAHNSARGHFLERGDSELFNQKVMGSLLKKFRNNNNAEGVDGGRKLTVLPSCTAFCTLSKPNDVDIHFPSRWKCSLARFLRIISFLKTYAILPWFVTIHAVNFNGKCKMMRKAKLEIRGYIFHGL